VLWGFKRRETITPAIAKGYPFSLFFASMNTHSWKGGLLGLLKTAKHRKQYLIQAAKTAININQNKISTRQNIEC